MEFVKFLVQAKINTYATAGESDEKILEDGCKELGFSNDNFRYRDRYYGSNPFIGEEIVWKNDKKIWGMNYYGSVASNLVSSEKVYQFLKIAMQKIEESCPFRGPSSFLKDNFEYINESEGDINLFKGIEIIKYKRQEVYRLYYHGGRM